VGWSRREWEGVGGSRMEVDGWMGGGIDEGWWLDGFLLQHCSSASPTDRHMYSV
jgi:hypothetical protein